MKALDLTPITAKKNPSFVQASVSELFQNSKDL